MQDLPNELYKHLDGLDKAMGMEIHLDTDEGNAVMLREAQRYELMKQESDGSYTTVFTEERQGQPA